MLEVWNLFHRALDEVKHLIVILVDTKLDLVLDSWLDRDDLLIHLFGQLTEITVLSGLHSSRSKAVVDDRDLSKEVAWSENLFLFVFLLLFSFGRGRNCAFVVAVLRDLGEALTFRNEEDGVTFLVLLDDDGVWLTQLSLHPLHDRPDQLFFFSVQVFHTAWILAHRHDVPCNRRDSRL